MTQRPAPLFVAILFAWPALAHAQFVGGGALFEPEIGVVSSGVLLDAQATVSADRKYVTLNMRPSQSQLLSLSTFEFQRGNAFGVPVPAGFVGGVNPVIAGPRANLIPHVPNAPMALAQGNGGTILLKRGITPLLFR